MLQAARSIVGATSCAVAIVIGVLPIAPGSAAEQWAGPRANWPADFVLTKATLYCPTGELDVRMTSGPLEYALWMGKSAGMPDADRFLVVVTPVARPTENTALVSVETMAAMDHVVLSVTSNGKQSFDIRGKTDAAKPAARILPGTRDYERGHLMASLVISGGHQLRQEFCSLSRVSARGTQELDTYDVPVASIAASFVRLRGEFPPIATTPLVAQPAQSAATWPADFVLKKATLDCATGELDVEMTSGPLEYTLWIGKHARMPGVDCFSVAVTPLAKPSGANAAMVFMDNAMLIVTSNGLEDPFDMHGKTVMAKPAARILPGTSAYERRYLPANLVMISGGHLRQIFCSSQHPAAGAKQQLGADNALVKTIAQSFVTLRLEFPR